MNVAAIVYKGGASHQIDAMLESVASELKRDGARLAGAIQINDAAAETACSKMSLEELTSGRRFEISICKKPGEKGCTLDATALEEAAGFVAATLAEADLLILNRFGKQEAAGEGFRNVIQQAVIEDIPVVVTVNEMYSKDWAAFAGPDVATLRPERETVSAWCRGALKQSSKRYVGVE